MLACFKFKDSLKKAFIFYDIEFSNLRKNDMFPLALFAISQEKCQAQFI